jgi:ADP-heptose:LPS heptosyltransferase/GT2 family glycosyltransferase
MKGKGLPDRSRLDNAGKRVRDASDIDVLHMLFLGRAAESEQVRADNYGKPVLDVAEVMIESEEFRDEVLNRFLADGALPHNRLSAEALRKVAEFAAEHDLATATPEERALEAHARQLEPLAGRAFVAAAYRIILGREPDPEGEEHYLARLEAADTSKRQIIAEMLGSDESRQRGMVMPFGWRSTLHQVFAFGPVRRLLDRHCGPTGRKFVAALETAHVPLLLDQQTDQDLSEDAVHETAPVEQECVADCSEMLKLYIDRPEIADASAEFPIRNRLLIEGWALARSGVASIDLSVDGERVSAAHYGLPRWDVAEEHPGWANTKNSGFIISIPSRSLPKGRHAVCITLRDNTGNTKETQFWVDVAEDSEEDSLRRKISQAEINLQDRILSSLDWHPKFCFLMSVGYGRDELARAQSTLASMREQAYPDWRVYIALDHHGIKLDRLRDRLLDGSEDVRTLQAHFQKGSNIPKTWRYSVLDGFDDIADRVEILQKGEVQSLTDLTSRFCGPVLFSLLAAGDILSSDALLEFAVISGMYRDADFFYSDELRVSPVSKIIEPFLKPQWSPDLLLSTNYIGRLWCASAELIEHTRATFKDVFRLGEYNLVLQATEIARGIRHIPELLCRRGDERLDSEAMERRALEQAMSRRGIAGDILAGCVSGIYRVRRRLTTQGLVSIIIPTRASRGLIRTCIETLRSVTIYRNFEIIGIDNIPNDNQEWKNWLHCNVDKVVEIAESFNWARFNNRAVEAASGEFLLFLNDDVEIIEPGWLEALLEHGQRPEVAIVGPMLLWPNRTIQSAGVFLTHTVGIERHAFRNAADGDPGYFGLALSQRNAIAVNGACLLTRRDVFERLGGFNEAHRVVNNETDYCLKAWREGMLTVFTPYSKLIHHERSTRQNIEGEDYDSRDFEEQWRALFADGDPYHHPLLSKDFDCFTPELEPLRAVRPGHPLARREAIRSILLVKLDHIGDCITAFPAIRRLKEAFPHASLRVLASNWTKSIWPLAKVDEVIEFDFFHTRADQGIRELTEKELQALGERLAPYRFDLAVDLRRHPETRNILRHTGARFLAGFDHRGMYQWLDIALEWGGDAARERKRDHAADELVKLADAICSACDPERAAITQLVAEPFLLSDSVRSWLFTRRVVCVHPAAGDMLKQWPPEYFAELIDLLVEREQVNVVLIGGPADKTITSQVLRSVRNRHAVVDLIGEPVNKLAQVHKLLLRCALFVGNDSGPKHLAAALGVPTVGIHSGHLDAREWGPVGPYAIALRREMACGPCYLPSPKFCPRDLACLTGLRPGQVYPVCRKLLAAEFTTTEIHANVDASLDYS